MPTYEENITTNTTTIYSMWNALSLCIFANG